jgi:hypothetical protein
VLGPGVEIERQVADVFPPSVRKVTCWLACIPWALSTSNRRRFGLVSWVCTYPKQLGFPSAGMALPAITSNQPSRRDRCSDEWT